MVRAHSSGLQRIRGNFLALALSGVLVSCASLNQQGGLTEQELNLNQYAAMTSADAVRKLEQEYQSSARRKLNVYAPKHYLTAGKALGEAKKLISQNGPRDEIVKKVAVGEAVLRNANRVMRKVKESLADELAMKNKLEELKTPEVYGVEYGSLVERLDAVIQQIETGHSPEQENREKLIKDMQRLEFKARRYNAMHEPEEILKRVKYRGGETLAPLTYREAMEVFKRADEFIKQNPTYETGIEQIGKEALFAAKRALYITEQVAALTQKFNMSPEQIVLDEEYRLHRVARELADEDLRDHPLEVQSEMLAKTAKSVADELQKKDELVLALRDTLIKVRDSSTQLTALSETARQLKSEKSEWLAKEALFKAKIDELEEKLEQAVAELDHSQQTILSLQSENIQLAQSLQKSRQELAALNQQMTREQEALAAKQQKDEQAPAASGIEQSDEASVVIQTAEPVAADKSMAAAASKQDQNGDTTEAVAGKNDETSRQVARDEPATETDESKAAVQAVVDDSTDSVSQKEALQALQSAKELIKILRQQNGAAEDTKADADNARPVAVAKDQKDDKAQAVEPDTEEDVFVDASE